MMPTTHTEFRNKTLRNIRLWAVLAAILLTAGLIYIVAVWLYGSAELFKKTIIIAPSIMLLVTASWWGWTIRTVSKLINHWNETKDDISTVVVEIKELKQLVREIIILRKDK